MSPLRDPNTVLAHGGVLDAAGESPFPAWATDVVFLGVPALAFLVALLVLERLTRPADPAPRPEHGGAR